jgi:hypothetical protein
MVVVTMTTTMVLQPWAKQLEPTSRLRKTQNMLRNTQFSNTFGENWPVTSMTIAATGFLTLGCLRQTEGTISFLGIKSEG